jgi:hypothetical protein
MATFFALKTIIADPDRKGLLQIVREFSHLSVRARTPARHYFSSLLYKRGVDNPGDYLTLHELHHPQEVLCERGAVDIAANKLLFQEFFQKRGLPLPRLLAYNFGTNMYIVSVDGSLELRDMTDSKAVGQTMELLFARSAGKGVFAKLINGSLGVGARRIPGPMPLADAECRELQDTIASRDLLFQEEIEQHQAVSTLNPACINTIRIDTFKPRNGEAEIVSALIRIGVGQNVVDNIAAGGIFVGVDLSSGRLKERGVRNLKTGGKFYEGHPDTGTVFNGFQLPFWSDVKSLALAASNLIPAALMGWDVALSSRGPVLLEANAIYYSMELSDIAYGGYRTNPVFRKALTLANGRP